MRIEINLASRPYRELGPIYKRLRILIAVLTVLAAPLWLLTRSQSVRAAAAHRRFVAAENRVIGLQRQQQSYTASMRQPANAAVLQQAEFLNALFARKAFSWTAIMMDLENVLPSGVQVLNIDPETARGGSVTIHLRVSGERERAVELVRNLEHSRSFLLPRLAGETAENASHDNRGFQQVSAANVDFDILADYNPLPAPTPAKSTKPAASVKNAAKAPARRAAKTATLKPAARGARRTAPGNAGAGRGIHQPPASPRQEARP